MRSSVDIVSEAGRDPGDVSYCWACRDCGTLGDWTDTRDEAEDDGGRHSCQPQASEQN
jgi:hypothetical protein